ncbi:hypothetical protein L1987_20576 [Smallanthus sonchifolius]|uniref:Uncharacterized protein n=1 Tax=Smallanthus sonchifolius TaxID=185202 RepID=A0ACB9ITZ7_9ASTR|nr:hypothetical protein L1987_20576 [Smallanthus sonchifolius]
MLDKSKFFFLDAALFSGVSSMLYPVENATTSTRKRHTFKMAVSILRHEGFKGLYRGFGTSLMGTIPARALYMGALETTKSNLGCTTVKAAAIANAAAGLAAAMASQLVWTPIDVVSQRLMVQGGKGTSTMIYNGGIDAFKRIIHRDGVRGLYKGFGISILTYAPSNAVWWASYSMAYRSIWGGVRSYGLKKEETVGGPMAVVAVGYNAVGYNQDKGASFRR